MSNDFSGLWADTTQRIQLNADTADLSVGGNGRGGDIRINDDVGVAKIRLDAGGKEFSTFAQGSTAPTQTILLNGADGEVVAGGNGQDGSLVLRNGSGKKAIVISTASRNVRIENDEEQPTLILGPAGLIVGGNGSSGSLAILPSNADASDLLPPLAILLDSLGNIRSTRVVTGVLREVLKFDAGHAALYVGSQDNAGDVIVKDQTGKEVLQLNGGGHMIIVRDSDTKDIIRLNAQPGGDNIAVQDGSGKILLAFDNEAFGNTRAGLFLGVHTSQIDPTKNDGKPGVIGLRNAAGVDSIFLDGAKGDIGFANADCAEEFDLADEGAEPGTVMVLDDEGRLIASRTPYDRRVAGVVTGAGDYRPGIVLDRRDTSTPRTAIALTGKTYCKVDARHGPIAVGDLLTTSLTPGHAMRASEQARAFGAVIGKALQPLPAGTGLIPVLVALQ